MSRAVWLSLDNKCAQSRCASLGYRYALRGGVSKWDVSVWVFHPTASGMSREVWLSFDSKCGINAVRSLAVSTSGGAITVSVPSAS